MIVYSYWKCPQCNKIIRGDSRECLACGNPIPKDVKYLMPDNPEVINAKNNGTILIKSEISEKYVDEKGISSDVVAEKDINRKPNWNCAYCGNQNNYYDTTCTRCGAGKEESESDYFNHKTEISDNDKENYTYRTGMDYEDMYESSNHKKFNDENIKEIEEDVDDTEEIEDQHSYSQKKINNPIAEEDIIDNGGIVKNVIGFMQNLWKSYNTTIISVGLIVIVIVFLLWLLIPITKYSLVTGFSWERNIHVEEYTLCHEDDWSVPNGGKVTQTNSEIHHYDQVIDHYEHKSREVSEQVLDGYDTSYRDLGNGQCETVQTPRYKTVYHTEYYDEPVYKDVPVYKTKYYYDIDRWIYIGDLYTNAQDHTPYWKETNIPEDVENPTYGDKRLGVREEKYYLLITDAKGNSQYVEKDYNSWVNSKYEDKIEYKAFRFGNKALYTLD